MIRVGAVLCVLFWSASLFAFELSPLVHRLAVNGKFETSLMIINPGDRPLALEFVPWRLAFNAGGELMEQQAAHDDFVIFPPTVLVPPGGRQRVMLRHVGPVPDHSLSYYVTAAQVPLLPATEQGVQLLLALNALVHVQPVSPLARLGGRVLSVTRVSEYSEVRVRFANTGNTYAYLNEFTLDFEQHGRRHRLDPKAFEQLDLRRFVPPGAAVEVVLPLPGAGWTSELALRVLPPAS